MAFNQIDTGYKPDGALGALYQGYNAADAQQMNALEMIKAALANQREQQMQPLDIEKAQLSNKGMVFDNMVKALQGVQAETQNTPQQLNLFAKSKEAGYNKDIREDELSGVLQPFKLAAAPAQGHIMVNDARSDATLSDQQSGAITGIDATGNQLTPEQQRSFLQQYSQNVPIRGNTPQQYGKENLEDIKGWWDLQKANVAASATRDAASVGGKAAWAQALPVAERTVANIQNNLTKLRNNELGDEIAARVRAAGKKPGTLEYKQALESEKQKLGATMQQELLEAKRQYDLILQASGLLTNQPVPASASSKQSSSQSTRGSSSGNVIKLD